MMVVCFVQELESLADPMRKEVLIDRKKIDSVYKELKPLSYSVQKKVTYHYSFKIGLVSFLFSNHQTKP